MLLKSYNKAISHRKNIFLPGLLQLAWVVFWAAMPTGSMYASAESLSMNHPTLSPTQEFLSVPKDISELRDALHNARLFCNKWTNKDLPHYRMQEWYCLKDTYPFFCDWLLQDLPWPVSQREKALRFLQQEPSDEDWQTMIARVRAELGEDAPSTEGPSGLEQYVKACCERRRYRLKPLMDKSPQVVFTKHCNIGSHFNAGWTHYAFNESLSETTAWQYDWEPGSELCVLTVDAEGNVGVETLLRDSRGIIRDPDVSYDGNRILFAWKKSLRTDDYHLYEMDLRTRTVRQLTNEKGQADYEAAYLPDGAIVFNSTRCVQMVDCWSTPVSNLFRCDADGENIRRLTYDQVHNNYPRVLHDGRIVYTRWEYSDRGQIFPQPLFTMRPDGTAQMAIYGDNSWFPTSLLHARPIPESSDLMAILSGHHTGQVGLPGIVNLNEGEEEAAGITYLAPVREATPVIQDGLGQGAEVFSHPYPLDRETFIVSYADGLFSNNQFQNPYTGLMDLYLFKADGRRELLAMDRRISCNQPVPLSARPKPPVIASTVDAKKTKGYYFLQDIYEGPGLEGIERGSVKRLRIVEIVYRAAGIGSGRQFGISGDSAVCTPVAACNGTWDVKRVLGEIEIGPDGSAAFEVPAEMPVYFQALDENRHAIQTMRSWSTLQRGEMMSCVGCHETKRQIPDMSVRGYGQAGETIQIIEPFYGMKDGFSFIKEIQPILDKHCIRCHYDTSAIPEQIRANDPHIHRSGPGKAFSLLGTLRIIPEAQTTRRLWSDSYLALTGGRAPSFWASAGGLEQYWGPDYQPYPESAWDFAKLMSMDTMHQEGTLSQHLPIEANRGGTELVNWIHAQSIPPMLKPYAAGAATSKLMKMLRENHQGVALSQEELDKIACWIDLCVPFCGDYLEANDWTQEEIESYHYYMQRREQLSGPDIQEQSDSTKPFILSLENRK